MTPRTLRLPDDMDAALALAAGIHRTSVNAEILTAIRAHLLRLASTAKGAPLAALLNAAAARAKP